VFSFNAPLCPTAPGRSLLLVGGMRKGNPKTSSVAVPGFSERGLPAVSTVPVTFCFRWPLWASRDEGRSSRRCRAFDTG